jgi:signal transduction histidine kinase
MVHNPVMASVGRRLFLLVACQTAIALALVFVGVRTISRSAADYRHMYDFQFKSVAAIGEVMQKAAELKPGSKSAALNIFYHQYRTDWETATGTTPDAIQFRDDLVAAGATSQMRSETRVLEDLRKSLDVGDTENIRMDLAALYNLNVEYASLANEYVKTRARNGRIRLILIGLIGTTLSLLLGLHVVRAIAPRIRRLVTYIRNFQENGVHHKIGDMGKDDIALLANALDAGFSAIASRERERAQFLAVAAHELKTPVTSIHGYASLLARSKQNGDLHRAIDTINRQSARLSRLIDAMLLAGQARFGKLQFEPGAFDVSALVSRVMQEMEPLLSKKTFVAKVEPNISILGDETLLEHALWSLFTCASAFSEQEAPLYVHFSRVDHQARLTIDVRAGSISMPVVQDLFTPFRFVEYETGTGVRSAIGLYLCREIVRLHNGSLLAGEVSQKRPEFLMELPV